MVRLGLKPGVAGWKLQTSPLSYGGTLICLFLCHWQNFIIAYVRLPACFKSELPAKICNVFKCFRMHYAGKNHERRARNFLQIWSVEKNLPMPKKKDDTDLSNLNLYANSK